MEILEPVQELFKPVENLDYEILSILEDSKRNLWLGPWSDGVGLYNRHTGETTSYLGAK
ncbi:MAG: hypothetical protein LUH22_09085 [Bacteroides sp.]|nr:hypothetical protein [Bacteroides sp.]